MELVKDNWTAKNIKEFNKYLESIKRPDKIEFSKKTVNTEMNVLGIDCPTCKNIAKKIHEGNFISFLEKNDFKYYENTQVSAYLINYIKDVNEKEKYINSLYMDNWATVDSLKYNIKKQEEEFLKLSKKYIKSKETFKRRVGVRILFSYTNTKYVDEIFTIIDSLYKEKEYYVNMAVAWLCCELMIKNRTEFVEYLKHHHLNDFTINKAISKCRDSFRVSDKDKEMLLKYKK
ncbi:MAG: DNA alkylation repair protein [Clostridia bacterium]|nr:DNA alkylation repair protein [Clostridia bacterium]